MTPANSTDDFDFDAPAAGLRWMLTKKDRCSHFTNTRAVNAHPAVVICPPEAVDKIADTLVTELPNTTFELR